jgi:hypothetical protein
MKLNEKTTVPLFAVIAAIAVGMSGVGGSLLFVAAISAKADAAHAKTDMVSERVDRISQYVQEGMKSQGQKLDNLSDRSARMEEKIDILLKHLK